MAERIDDKVVELELLPINTPGHTTDHLCFILKEKVSTSLDWEYMIFSGDSIVGANNTHYEDYPIYLKNLYKTKDLIEKYDIKKMFVAHSVSLLKEHIVLDAKWKVNDYIVRRKK